MKKSTITKMLITISIIALTIMASSYVFAGITPGQLTGDPDLTKQIEDDFNGSFVSQIKDIIRQAGTFIAVGALMVIGIKYIMGSVEEKANYKKSMMPYVIGCFVLFGASYLVPEITDALSDLGTDGEVVGNKILGLIQVIGSFVAVGVLMVLGIKYMAGSAEQRASYKKSMIPYLIGSILLFSAVNITSVIYDFTIQSTDSEYRANAQKELETQARKAGKTDAGNWVTGISRKWLSMPDGREKDREFDSVISQIDTRSNSARQEAINAKNDEGEDSYNYIYWTTYVQTLRYEKESLKAMAGLL